MPDSLTGMPTSLRHDGDRITVTISGGLTVADGAELLDEVARLSVKSGVRQCLIVLDEGLTALETLDRHQLGVHAAKVLPRDLRFAAVGPAEGITGMFESAAATRGLIVRVFDDVGTAETWLTS